MALRTSVVSGTLAGPWVYNDYLSLFTNAMQDQPVNIQGSLALKAVGALPGAPTLSIASGGSVNLGAHTYAVTFVGPNGETAAGATAAVTTTTGNLTVNLSSIPTGPTGTTKRNVYRSKVGTTTPLFFSGSINDNTTTTYSDTIADTTLTNQPPSHSTFGGYLSVLDSSGNVKGAVYSDGAISFDNGGIISDGAGNLTVTSIQTSGGGLLTVSGLQTTQSGAVNGLQFKVWTGAAAATPFAVSGDGNTKGSAPTWIGNTGQIFQALPSNSTYIQMSPSTGTVARWTFAIDASGNMVINDNTSAGGITMLAGSGLKLGGQFIQSNSSILGFKNSGGAKMAELNSSGAFIITGSNPCFYTTAASVGFSSGGSFDTFDISEAFPTDSDYAAGVVLCPGPDHKLTQCTHDACRAALVVSQQGALAIGMGFLPEDDGTGLLPDPTVKPMALAGRVLVGTDEAIPAFTSGLPTLVTSNGRGGVRAMRSGEAGFALGYALHDAEESQLGIVVRPMFAQA